MNDILRRKVARGGASPGEGGLRAATGAGIGGGPGADHGWRLAFARAARDMIGLLVDVASLRLVRRGLAELLELPPDRALIVLLDGPGGGLGMVALSPELTSAMVEMQAIGRVSATAPPARRPTRTDAAMVSGVIDRALVELEAILADEADLEWAGGFRYASFLEDPRPLGLLLEDQTYRVLTAEISVADGARKGQLLLALPAEGRGIRPPPRAPGPDSARETPMGFSLALGEAVLAADCQIEAVIARFSIPLRQVMDLQAGQVLPLATAALDRIMLQGIDGRHLALSRLGQHRGMRAVRISDAQDHPDGQGRAMQAPGGAASSLALTSEPGFGVDGDASGDYLALGDASSAFLATG